MEIRRDPHLGTRGVAAVNETKEISSSHMAATSRGFVNYVSFPAGFSKKCHIDHDPLWAVLAMNKYRINPHFKTNFSLKKIK